MPLPFIVGGVWAGAAYLAHKSQKEVKQKIDEHNKIWDRIENISNSSKALAILFPLPRPMANSLIKIGNPKINKNSK